VAFVTEEDGWVMVLAATDAVAALADQLPPPANSVSLEELAQAVPKQGGRR